MARKRKGTRDPLFDPDPRLFSPPLAECWFGVCLRAPVSHGRVVGLVHPPLPGNFVLVGPGQIPGNESFQVLKVKLPLLPEHVHYVGEPLALLAGPDEHTVRAFAAQSRFVIVPSGPEPGPHEQAAHGHTRTVQRGAVLETRDLPADCLVVESTTSSGAQDHGRFDALEVLANVTEVAMIRVKSQWPAHVVQSVARALDLDPAQVQVMATTTAGLTGSQVWFPSLYSVYAAVLSKACAHPVLMRLTRQEDFHHSPKRPECRTKLRSVVTRDGRILSLQADVVVQVGAWPVMAEELLDRTLVGLLTPYYLEHFEVTGTAQVSATPPRGPVGSNGEAMGLFALENHVQDLCRELDLDPIKWRMANAVAKDQPWFTGLVPKAENPLRPLMAEAARVTDFSRKQAAFELLAQDRSRLLEEALPLRGIGVASGFQGNGFLAGGSPVHLEGRLEETGQLSLYIPLVTPNARQIELWKQSAAAILQLSVDNVRICPVFSGDHPTGGPSFASRAFEIIPRLLLQTCEALAQKRFRQPLPLTVRSVYRRNKGPAWDAEQFTGQPFLSLTWCAAVAEVQIIPHRAEVEIVRLSLVVDAGPRIDESAARNALIEGVQMAVGWTLTEALGWDQGGVDTGLGRYRLPGPRELPPIEIRFLENANQTRPHGLGNLGAHAVAPALLGAIRQALGQASSLSSIPVSRKMLDEALRLGGNAR